MTTYPTHRFTDAQTPGKHSVYRLYAEDGRLLYIGCAGDVEGRVYMHRRTYSSPDAFLIHRHYHRHTAQEFPNRLAARAAERAAIESEGPLLNRQHNPTRWRRVNNRWEPANDETLAVLAELSKRPEPNPDFVAFFDSLFRRDEPART